MYSNAAGEVTDPKTVRFTWRRQASLFAWTRHEIDVADHRRIAKLGGLDLPTARHAHHLEATLNIGFRVTDPAEVVRRNITYGASAILNYVTDALRATVREFEIDEAHLAEERFNHEHADGIALPEGIRIYHVSAQLAPDLAARQYLADRRDSQRHREIEAERHEQAKLATMRANEIRRIEHRGELERHKEALSALRGLDLDPYQLLLAHVAENPKDAEGTFDLIMQVWKAGIDRDEARDVRSSELLTYLIEKGVMQAVDIERFRDELTDRIREAVSRKRPTPAGWTEPPVLSPVKLGPASTVPPPRPGADGSSVNGTRSL
ncbi:hypothetical protein [Plantactinospora sp. KBS50]|uniref:hypothetical protein n=1 Tax=Plantactinospora sp. KBS50 TaxID=2024580 RepID=UPI0012FE0A25|nr:hypothetical protein [Plantactinospora sp. KBS50]